MTKEEIKGTFSMTDIVERYGFHPNRAGFISCPFHKGDRTPSLKVYKNDFHCHACGANGDIFTFVQRMDNLTFREAFESLGGTYEHTPTGHYQARLKAYRAQKKRATEHCRQEKLIALKRENNDVIYLYRLYLSVLEPFSDMWCDIYNKLQYQLYIHGELNDLR